METTRWIAALALAGGCLPFGSGSVGSASLAAPRPDSRSVYGTGEIVGMVVDSVSGAPIPNVVLFATTDTSIGAPVTPWRTASDPSGRFVLADVPAGWRVIEARGIGYARQRRTVVVRRGGSDTVWVTMRAGNALLAQQRDELSLPTAVTPCRPADVNAAWLTTALAEALAAPGPAARHVSAEQIRLVTKPSLCRRAVTAWQEQAGKPLHDPQVYLFELGDAGYALYDPVEALGSGSVVVPVLDRGFKLLRVLAL